MRAFPFFRHFLACAALVVWPAFHFSLHAQFQLEGLATYWSDALHEWVLYTAEGEEGKLSATWHWRGDFSEWDYRIGEEAGDIRLKWKDDPEEWELRSNNRIISGKTRWRGDFREWRITDNERVLILRTRWGNARDEWIVDSEEYGRFYMYTVYAADPREWFIEDGLEQEIDLPMKLMVVFLVLFQSAF